MPEPTLKIRIKMGPPSEGAPENTPSQHSLRTESELDHERIPRGELKYGRIVAALGTLTAVVVGVGLVIANLGGEGETVTSGTARTLTTEHVALTANPANGTSYTQYNNASSQPVASTETVNAVHEDYGSRIESSGRVLEFTSEDVAATTPVAELEQIEAAGYTTAQAAATPVDELEDSDTQDPEHTPVVVAQRGDAEAVEPVESAPSLEMATGQTENSAVAVSEQQEQDGALELEAAGVDKQPAPPVQAIVDELAVEAEASPVEQHARDHSETAAPPSDPRIARAQFTNGVRNREPIDQIESVVSAEGAPLKRLYYFTELRNMRGETVTHRWVHGGEVAAEVTFNVGGNRWRVYSSKNLTRSMSGDWEVVVVDSQGNTLTQANFIYEGS